MRESGRGERALFAPGHMRESPHTRPAPARHRRAQVFPISVMCSRTQRKCS